MDILVFVFIPPENLAFYLSFSSLQRRGGQMWPPVKKFWCANPSSEIHVHQPFKLVYFLSKFLSVIWRFGCTMMWKIVIKERVIFRFLYIIKSHLYVFGFNKGELLLHNPIMVSVTACNLVLLAWGHMLCVRY